jgi:hypothetical protein
MPTVISAAAGRIAMPRQSAVSVATRKNIVIPLEPFEGS